MQKSIKIAGRFLLLILCLVFIVFVAVKLAYTVGDYKNFCVYFDGSKNFVEKAFRGYYGQFAIQGSIIMLLIYKVIDNIKAIMRLSYDKD